MSSVGRILVAFAVSLVLAGCGTVTATSPTETPLAPEKTGEPSWTRIPPGPLSARREAAGAYVDGRFYVVGGWSDPPCPPTASCAPPVEPAHRDGAAYDPATGRWRSIAEAPVPVGGVLQMTVVGTALYLITGGYDRRDSPVTFLRYDTVENGWSVLPGRGFDYPQLVVAGTKIIVVGQSDEQEPVDDRVFDTVTERWDSLPDDPLGPSYGRTAAWLGDRLLLGAAKLVPDPGADGPSLTRLAVLDRSLRQWELLPDTEILGGHPVWVADRVVFPMTGSEDGGAVGNWGRAYANGAIFDPADGSWSSLPKPPVQRTGLEGIGGSVGDRTLVGGHLLQPVTRTWTPVPQAPWGQDYRVAQTVITSPQTIFVWGGSTERDNLAEGYVLSI